LKSLENVAGAFVSPLPSPHISRRQRGFESRRDATTISVACWHFSASSPSDFSQKLSHIRPQDKGPILPSFYGVL
jgi:hypothetical protein